jgi:membrane protease YdiL (CAAX protease family)
MNNRQFVLPTLSHQLISVVSWVAVAEELTLRGYLQPKLEARCGKWPGLVLTAILFSVLHLPKIFLRQASAPILLVVAFVLGIVFGFIRDKTDSIYYPVFCHVTVNLIAYFTSGS